MSCDKNLSFYFLKKKYNVKMKYDKKKLPLFKA